jgi:arylformamidase
MQIPELEAAYNARAAVPEHPALFARWRADSERVREILPAQLDLRYGPGEAETLDFFPADPGAPLHVFIHGGYWQALDKRDFSYLAPAWHAAGVAFAVLNYGLCPAVSLDDIVDQMRRALVWLHGHGKALGVDVSRLQLSGHSAGGHLCAMLLATDWQVHAPAIRDPLIHSAVSISGLFDLAPLRHTSMNIRVGMDADCARRNSPLHLRPTLAAPLLLAVGEKESADFHAQSDSLATGWGPHLPLVRRLTLNGCHHMAAVDELGRAGSALFEAARSLLQ